MKQIITRTDDGIWHGMCLLLPESFPSELKNPEELQSGLLHMLSSLMVSVEFSILKDGTSAPVQTGLILRWQGFNPALLERRVRQDSEMILKKLELAGIHVRSADTVEEIETWLHRIQSAASAGVAAEDSFVAFCPKETVLSGPAGPACIPGFWGSGNTQAPPVPGPERSPRALFSWTDVFGMLPADSPCCLSFQITPTALRREERILIAKYTSWMDSADKGLPKDPSNRFRTLLALKDAPLFLLNLFLCANPETGRLFTLTLQEKGLDAVRIPAPFFHQPGYLILGDERLSFLLDHTPQVPAQLPVQPAPGLRRLSRIVSAGELQALLPLPGRPDQLSGLQTHRNRPAAKPLPDLMRSPKDSILVGVNEQTNDAVYYPIRSLSRHGCIVGKPGSGKTTFALGFLYRIWEKKIPFLAIEPAKREYRCLVSAIPELKVYTPGNNHVAPLQMNLFLPPAGITLQEYLPCVDQIFDIAFSMTSLLKDVFTKVIRRCYQRYGWRDESTRDDPNVQPFGLHEFIREFRTYTREAVYDPESRNNVENSGVLRLQKLLEANPVMFDTCQSPDYEKLLSEPTVIELDALSDPVQKTLVMAILVVNLMAVLRRRTDYSGTMKNLIMIDEAHVLLNPGDSRRDSDAADPGGAGLKLLQDMTMILRAYGTALFFGDQSPAKLTKEIVGNVGLKLMFGLDDSSDRQLLAGITLMTPEMLEQMVTLRNGRGYLACSELPEPVLLQTPDTEKELNLQKNVPDRELQDRDHPKANPPFSQCGRCTPCAGNCSTAIRQEARFLAKLMALESRKIRELLPPDPEQAQKTQAGLPEYLQDSFLPEAEKLAEEKGVRWDARMAGCLKIQMIRELLISGSCTLTERQLWGEEAVEVPPESKHTSGLMNLLDFRQ